LRIAIVNWTRRRVGGIETYLNTIVPELVRAGHEVAFWHEVDLPQEREMIGLLPVHPAWCAAELGSARSLTMLRDWQPDVVYSHKIEDPKLEAETIRIAPSVYFAHDYQGMCISGTKTFRYPVASPCGQRFGRKCLAHYYPHRCGGLSPLTMLKLYGLQKKRLELMHRYDAIVTHSEHMLAELIEHGLSARQAYRFPYYVHPTEAATGGGTIPFPITSTGEVIDHDLSLEPRERTYWHLLFSGRMELLKGGHVFLDALPEVAAALDRPLRVTFAGDGRLRKSWERQAARLRERDSRLEIEFIGWTDRPGIVALLDECDLMVVPSLWPEPFGLVGPEAGLKGVPVAAFDVGGIGDWLTDGVNGYLASGDPPTASGLAGAIVGCLRDPLVHARLRRGAVTMAKRFNIKNHLTALMEVFESVVREKELPASRTAKTRVW
jgi:glycosyltransferase involved in cell wall biosynthesis